MISPGPLHRIAPSHSTKSTPVELLKVGGGKIHIDCERDENSLLSSALSIHLHNLTWPKSYAYASLLCYQPSFCHRYRTQKDSFQHYLQEIIAHRCRYPAVPSLPAHYHRYRWQHQLLRCPKSPSIELSNFLTRFMDLLTLQVRSNTEKKHLFASYIVAICSSRILFCRFPPSHAL